MAGLTREGFIPLSLDDIKTRIETRLNIFNPGFDFSPDSPDGQLINIMSAELSLLWTELDRVYNSYNPSIAEGQALRNIAQITGVLYGVAQKSSATVKTEGITGTFIQAGNIVSDSEGNEFYTTLDVTIPNSVGVIAVVPGPIPIPAGTLINIETPMSGWTGITQELDGVIGEPPQSEDAYRNLRNRTVLKGSSSVQETLEGKLQELGLTQITILNNDTDSPLSGVPARTIKVTIGEYEGVSDEDIAYTIFNNIGMGTPTFGDSFEVIKDTHGYSHVVSFTKATAVPIYLKVEVEYLDDEYATADEIIKQSLVDGINQLVSGEDVVWSRLFGLITPYSKAQVNVLEVGNSIPNLGIINVPIDIDEYATCNVNDIDFTSVNA